MEKQRISPVQLGMLMLPTIMITAVLLVPAVTSEYAGRDLWISPIWASIAGVIIVFLAWKLHDLFKEKTIIQYSIDILGFVPGKIIGLLYLFFYLHINSLVLIQYSHFIVGYFLNETPIIVIVICMVVVCSLCVRSGVEVMARSSQVFTPLIIIFIIFIFLLLLPEMDIKHMFPIMGEGILPSIQGAATPLGWFSHFFVISFFLPYLSTKNKTLKSNILTVFIVAFTLIAVNLFSLLIFGTSTSYYTYPVWNAVRYISVGGFFEHIESLILVIWLGGVFVKITVFYYVLAIGTAQWVQVENYKPFVFPLGFILIAFTMWSFPTLQEMSTFFTTIAPYYLITVQFGLPFILLIIAFIRKKQKKDVDKVASE